jgi:hypothetical protein
MAEGHAGGAAIAKKPVGERTCKSGSIAAKLQQSKWGVLLERRVQLQRYEGSADTDVFGAGTFL